MIFLACTPNLVYARQALGYICTPIPPCLLRLVEGDMALICHFVQTGSKLFCWKAEEFIALGQENYVNNIPKPVLRM